MYWVSEERTLEGRHICLKNYEPGEMSVRKITTFKCSTIETDSLFMYFYNETLCPAYPLISAPLSKPAWSGALRTAGRGNIPGYILYDGSSDGNICTFWGIWTRDHKIYKFVMHGPNNMCIMNVITSVEVMQTCKYGLIRKDITRDTYI
jgi:hypothetical protein